MRSRRYTIPLLTALLTLLLGVTTPALAQEQAETKKGASIAFESLNHDFGTLTQGGEKVSYDFVFTNDGDAPLVITRTTTSCRCISIKTPKRPIKPGEKGSISVTFDPHDEGVTNKAIDIYANIRGTKLTLFVRGEVVREK